MRVGGVVVRGGAGVLGVAGDVDDFDSRRERLRGRVGGEGGGVARDRCEEHVPRSVRFEDTRARDGIELRQCHRLACHVMFQVAQRSPRGGRSLGGIDGCADVDVGFDPDLGERPRNDGWGRCKM